MYSHLLPVVYPLDVNPYCEEAELEMRNFASTSSLVGIAVIGSFLASIIVRYPSFKERYVDVYNADG
jgi:hypothetical protein